MTPATLGTVHPSADTVGPSATREAAGPDRTIDPVIARARPDATVPRRRLRRGRRAPYPRPPRSRSERTVAEATRSAALPDVVLWLVR